jgi:hypothetical protein
MYISSRCARGVAASISGVLLVMAGSALFAANAPTTAPSKAMREQMATLHEQMAACLRSDKSMSECRTEMMSSCQGLMGSQGCRTAMGIGMGMGGGMMGSGYGHMMSNPPSNSGTPK